MGEKTRQQRGHTQHRAHLTPDFHSRYAPLFLNNTLIMATRILFSYALLAVLLVALVCGTLYIPQPNPPQGARRSDRLTCSISFVHMDAAKLSLPIPRTLTIVVVILPFAAVINALASARLFRSAGSSIRSRMLPIVLQIFQAVAISVLGTLLFSRILSSAARGCLLSTTWQRLFSAHDADSIRRIQDSFNCCGFNTVQDRPWPFPNQHASHSCADTYGRLTPCAHPWQMALQRDAGLGFGVVLAIGLFQIASILFMAGNFVAFTSRNNRALEHATLAETERTRLLPAVAGSTSGRDNFEHESGGNRQVSSDVEDTGWTPSSHNPCRPDQI
ncbi:hypothetical protein ACCO45_012685 [Purpureocillium lilacinum]|uniref:Uncharacterized protein n=1 Tax=Purpureocillium lilacinum TaxID=33203 RepID=A0ACC4DA95_PURLI